MVRKSNRGNYTGISMPKELIDDVKRVIEENPQSQYRSIAEFTKSAIREKIQQIGKENNIEERLTRLEKIIDEKCNERAETVKQYLERPLV